MRVLIVSERYWPEVGAAPSRLANMAEGLHARRCDVDVLTSLPNYPEGRIFDGYRGRLCRREVHNGINLFRYWIFATVSRSAVKRALNMFSFAFMLWLFAFRVKRVKEYDVVLIQTPALVVAVSAMCLFKGLYHRKCVINVSDIWPLTAVDMGVINEGDASYKFMRRCEHYLYRRCDGVLGQSEEILNHVTQERILLGVSDTKEFDGIQDSDEILNSKMWMQDKELFLYRNLQTYRLNYDRKSKGDSLRIVFSGMLGVAQDVAGIVKNVPFGELGVEFHILGGGKQLEEIQNWCKEHPDGNVVAYGFVPKEQIAARLRAFDASLIPLSTRIRGAVPSKLYDVLPQGLPILFCGGGEGAHFIERHGIGLTSAPGDYVALIENIKKIRDLSPEDFTEMSARCIKVSKDELNFDKQMEGLLDWMNTITRKNE